MTARRTVDITVDAYDAPSLIAVARERERQRELGHDDRVHISAAPQAWGITAHGEEVNARIIKEMREDQDESESLTILMGEVAEVLETRIRSHRIVELVQVAATALRIASELKVQEDAWLAGVCEATRAKGGE